MQARVEAEGFRATPIGVSATPPTVRTALLAKDAAREERDLRDRFVRGAARRRVPPLLSLFRQWQPDVVVAEETDFAASIAAECLGLGFANVIVNAPGGFLRPDVIAEALDALRGEHELAPDPRLDAPGRGLVLAPFPPSYRDPADPLPATARAFRPAGVTGITGITEKVGSTGPRDGAWSPTRPGGPCIYFTLGTVFNMESGDLFERVLGGLRELPAELVVTVGRGLDPAALGPQPEGVHVARHLEQSEVLPHCDLVVSHGGSGSVIGALAHGLPSLLVPMGADQPLNAARCEALGVALALDASTLTPETVRDAAAKILRDPRYAERARALRAESEALPAAADMVPHLERLGG